MASVQRSLFELIAEHMSFVDNSARLCQIWSVSFLHFFVQDLFKINIEITEKKQFSNKKYTQLPIVLSRENKTEYVPNIVNQTDIEHTEYLLYYFSS